MESFVYNLHMKKFLALVLILLVATFFLTQARADVTEDLKAVEKELEVVLKEYNSQQSDYQKTNTQLQNLKSKIPVIEQEIIKKAQEVEQGEKVLEYQKQLLNERAKSYYKNLGKNPDSLLTLFVAENISQSLENFFYQKSLVNQDKDTIIKIVIYIKNLEEKKASLEGERERLTALKNEVDKQLATITGKIASTRQKIAQLTALQQQLIAQKQASLNLPKSAYTSQGGCSSDLTNGRNPGFGPAYGFFTFGVPHRVGLNQYGAKGRADSGQNAKQILEAYYNAEYKEGYDQGINIHVVGTNEYGQNFDKTWNIEEYLTHVYEVFHYWPMEALKAQAIAARSYALAYTNNGERTICPNQGCQVVKQEENYDSWKQAVDQTKGIVLLNDGKPISAYFSSTAGGYTYSSSNDIGSRPWTKNMQDGKNQYNNFDDIKNNAYDKESKWFYCDWGGREKYDNTAWLKSEEVADILNTLLLLKVDSSTTDNLYQTDKSNPAGKETWGFDKVKSELKAKGGNPFNNIDSISVNADFGSGRATSITFNGDVGGVTVDANEFKDRFNLRAPANIQIVGPLFNVEKR